MARLARLRSEGRAEQTLLIHNWLSWIEYLKKLKSDHKLLIASYNTLSVEDNPVACDLREVIDAPINANNDWTVIPILNKEQTDIKEIVIASPVNSSIRGLLMDVARWRQNGGAWKLEGNIESNYKNENYTNYPLKPGDQLVPNSSTRL